MTHSPIRRLMLVLAAASVSALLLRPQLSVALVLRGDELTYRSQEAHALVLYRRALAWDPDDAVAVDRLCFRNVISHVRSRVDEAIAVATRYLAKHPSDVTILADRALGEQVEHRYARAEEDFARAGSLARDPRLLTFAGFDALHAGTRARARQLFRQAQRIDVRFVPARDGLAQAR